MDISKDTVLNTVDNVDFLVCNGSALKHLGIINGIVEVADGTFELDGILNGSLLVSDNGFVTINGVANLDAIIGTGKVDVYGIVCIATADASRFNIHPGCIVNGIKH